MLDIVRYPGRIFASRVNIVAATPKFPVPVFELQLGKAFVQLQAAFSLQEARPAGHGILGRDFQPSLSVKHLPPEFWREHYVVFAVPARMSHCFYCRDAVYRPHRKISWRIFHHRQKASWNHLPNWWFSVYTTTKAPQRSASERRKLFYCCGSSAAASACC